MNRILAGTIAVTAGVALLLGSAGSLALWNQPTAADSGTRESGALTLAAPGTPAWPDIPADGPAGGVPIADIVDSQLVPTDAVELTQESTDDNLAATLPADSASIAADAAGTGVSYRTADTFAVPPTSEGAGATVLNEVIDDTSPTISFTGFWRSTASPSDFGGSIQFLYSSGSADLKFTGTSVSWMSRLTASSGKSAVYIDGVLAKTADGYSSTTRYAQTVFTSAVLPLGEHTISVRHTGTRNAASAGSNVIIDGFAVLNTQGATRAADDTSTPDAYRYAGCPAATVTVTNSSTLAMEMGKATPGTVIRMAPGPYTRLSLKANGTPDKPIWLCGPRDAIVSVGSIESNHAITVSDSSHFIVAGMTVTNGQKGITVRRSHHVTVADALVHTVGHEAIHFRENTTDSVVIGNTIRDTGLVHGPYGEGVYIGSSDRNWCALTACLPDRSDRNSVISNTISRTTAQSIEAKEGTTGGVIHGNVFDGLGMTNADSWVMVKGNDWKITSNTGTSSPQHGFEVNGSVDGWSYRNLFANNSARVDASGFGFKVYEPNGRGTSGTILSCTNTVTGAASGFAVAACTQ